MADLKDIIGIWSGDFWLGASEPQIIKRHRSKTCPSKDLAISAPLDFPIFHHPYGLGTALQNLRIKPEGRLRGKRGGLLQTFIFMCLQIFG